MNDENMSDEKEPLNKKAIAVVMVPIVLVSVFLVSFFTIFNGNDDTDNNVLTPTNVSKGIEISDADKIAVEGLSKQVLDRAGNFGVKSDVVTANNIDEMSTLLSTDVDSADYYFTPRAASYASLSDLILEDSPVYYSSDVTDNWTNDFEINSNLSFALDSDSVKTESVSEGSYVTVNGVTRLAVSVQVSFDSKETIFVEDGSEYGAERSYIKREKTFSNNTANFVFVQDENKDWKLYDIRNLKNQFLLSTWVSPDPDVFSDTQFDFKEVDRIVPPNQNVADVTDEPTE